MTVPAHDNQNVRPRDRLIRCPDVKNLTGVGRTNIYKLMAAGEFPRPIKLGSASLWSENAILEWIERQKARAALAA